MTEVLDLSNFTTNIPVDPAILYQGNPVGGRIDASHLACWRENGFERAVVGTQWPHVARHQLEVLTANRWPVSAYHWLWFDRDYMAELRRSIDVVAPFPINRLWIDIEDAATQLGANELVAIAEEVCQFAEVAMRARGVKIGIYTGRWWWPKMGGYEALSRYDLWLSDYRQGVEGEWPSSVPTRAQLASLPHPFGGWTKAKMWQYSGSIRSICASNLDFNVTFESIGEPIMQFLNGRAPSFENLTLPAQVDDMPINLITEFGDQLVGAEQVRLEVFLEPGPGSVELNHGDGLYAGSVRGYNGELHAVIDIHPDAAGFIRYSAPAGTHFELLGLLGRLP